MNTQHGFKAQVDHEGRLVIPAETALRYGLTPGTIVHIEDEINGFHLHNPITLLRKIYIEPTSRCNLTCRTCIRNTWDETMGFMTSTTYSKVIEGLHSLPTPASVFFGGFGEPLAHPDIVEMVASAKSAGARVELITNGTLLNKKRAAGLIAAGLDLLWVSIDGASPESYADVRLGASLPRVIENVSRLRDARGGGHFPKPEIGVVFVAMKRNVADLTAVLHISKRLGATHYLVTNVLPYTTDLSDEVLYRRVLNDIIYMQTPWVPQLDLPRIDINENTRLPLDQVKHGLHNMSLNGDNLGRASDRCPFIERGATAIAWDGSLSPCLPLLHSHISFPDKRMRTSRSYPVGNINRHPLSELWNDPEYTLFRQRVQNFEFSPCTFCGGCDLSEANEEDCYGNTFPVCGGCLWAQGVIQCP